MAVADMCLATTRATDINLAEALREGRILVLVPNTAQALIQAPEAIQGLGRGRTPDLVATALVQVREKVPDRNPVSNPTVTLVPGMTMLALVMMPLLPVHLLGRGLQLLVLSLGL